MSKNQNEQSEQFNQAVDDAVQVRLLELEEQRQAALLKAIDEEDKRREQRVSTISKFSHNEKLKVIRKFLKDESEKSENVQHVASIFEIVHYDAQFRLEDKSSNSTEFNGKQRAAFTQIASLEAKIADKNTTEFEREIYQKIVDDYKAAAVKEIAERTARAAERAALKRA